MMPIFQHTIKAVLVLITTEAIQGQMLLKSTIYDKILSKNGRFYQKKQQY
jgi:hypothetical protein